MFWNRVRQAIYAVATLVGFAWPIYFLVKFIKASEATTGSLGFDLPAFVEQVWANAASGFIAADLTVVLVIAIAFLISEAKRLKLRFWGLYIVLIFSISFAFGFSFFMFMRERKLSELLEPVEAQA